MRLKSIKIIDQYLRLPKEIYLLVLARVVTYSARFIFPFLSLYLVTRLDYSENTAGYFITAVAILSGPGLLLGGKLTDKIGRKKTFIYFGTAALICLVFCSILGSSGLVPFFLIAAYCFIGGQNPAINAMLIDLTDNETRKASFSLLLLGTNIGMALGPLVVGYLFNDFIRLIFLVNAFMMALVLLLIGFLVKETLPCKEQLESKEISTGQKAEKGNVLAILFRKYYLLIFSLLLIIFNYILAQSNFSLPLYLENLFGSKGTVFYGNLMTLNLALVIFITLFFISFFKKLNPVINVCISGILYAVGFGIIYTAKSFSLFIISTIIWTLGQIINFIYSYVYIAEHSPITHRGRFSALFPFISQAGFALAPMLSGLFIKYNGIKNLWPFIFYLGITAAFLMFILYLSERRKIARLSTKKQREGK
jgi:MFS family permease